MQKMDSRQLEKYSSAITLSDMEIFVFPELMYSLVLADIMSPIVWQWRELDCFKKLEGKSSYNKLMRLRQFIMDEFEFNLDLETWGLTSKAKEIKRFEGYISPETIAKSNALFGYHAAYLHRYLALHAFDHLTTDRVRHLANDLFLYHTAGAVGNHAADLLSLVATNLDRNLSGHGLRTIGGYRHLLGHNVRLPHASYFVAPSGRLFPI